MIKLTFSTDVLYYLAIIKPFIVQIKMKSKELNCTINEFFSYVF